MALLGIVGVRGILDPLQEIVAPLLVQLGQGIDVLVLVEIQRRGVFRNLRNGRLFGVDGNLVRVGHILNGRVGLHLLLDNRTQLQHRQLEHLQRLAQLRRQDHHLPLLLKKR